MTMISRAQWGARNPKRITAMPGPVHGIACHYEGVDLGDYSADSVPGRVKAIQAFHMGGQNWDDIAYSALVDRFGRVFVGRGPGVRTAANGTNDANAHYYAVCFLMGPNDHLTDEAKAGWLEARRWLQETGGAGNQIQPHSNFFNTSCPGNPARIWVNAGAPSPGLWSPPPSGSMVVLGAPIQPAPNAYEPDTVEVIVALMPTVQQGSTGQFAKIAQGLLCANGRTVSIDGNFGPDSVAKLREWQGKVGIVSDGICGPQTWRRLMCV